MRKKLYEQPTTEVVKLNQQCQLLVGSPAKSGSISDPDDYYHDSETEDPFEF